MATAKKTTKAEPTTVDASKLNVYQKLAIARKRMAEADIKKSGKTKFYDYIELKDFLPTTNAIFAELELIGTFKIKRNDAGLEIATLTIINATAPTEQIEFSSETAESRVVNGQPIQNLGSKHTYLRRYLWFEALELTDSDAVEALSSQQYVQPQQQFQQYAQQQYIPAPQAPVQQAPVQQAPTPAPAPQAPPTVDAIPITKAQIEMLEDLTKEDQERKTKMLAYYKVNGFNELSVKQAVQAINQLQKKEEDN